MISNTYNKNINIFELTEFIYLHAFNCGPTKKLIKIQWDGKIYHLTAVSVANLKSEKWLWNIVIIANLPIETKKTLWSYGGKIQSETIMIEGNGEAVVLEISAPLGWKMFNSTYIIRQLHYIGLLKKKIIPFPWPRTCFNICFTHESLYSMINSSHQFSNIEKKWENMFSLFNFVYLSS